MKTFPAVLTMLVVAMLLFVGGSHAETSTIFTANYGIEFWQGDGHYSIQSRDRVRSGHEIPIDMQRHKVGMQIEETSDGEFLLRLNVYERDGMSWFHINSPAPEFTGELGMPMEILWESGDIQIELAIAVSEFVLSE